MLIKTSQATYQTNTWPPGGHRWQWKVTANAFYSPNSVTVLTLQVSTRIQFILQSPAHLSQTKS